LHSFLFKQTSDGGFILGGFQHSIFLEIKQKIVWEMTDYWIVKTDSDGKYPMAEYYWR
jgi:hypothetical protein